jgi:outer membrane protein assembly factor BamB
MPSRFMRLTVLAASLSCSLAAEADTVLWGSSPGPQDVAALYTIDAGDGKAVPVGAGAASGGVSALALDPFEGTLYGILGGKCDGAVLVTIDQETGALTEIGVLQGEGFDGTPGSGCSGGAEALTFGHDGTLYAGGWNGGTPGGKLLTIDKTTGAVLANKPTDVLHGNDQPAHLAALATAPDGTLWAAHGYTPGALHTIDPDTGGFTSRLKLSDSGATVFGLAFGPDGTLYAAVKDGRKLASIETDGSRKGKVRTIGHFGNGLRIGGLELAGVEVAASDCTAANGGCNPTGGQNIEIPDDAEIPPDATLTQNRVIVTDPRVASGRCGKDPLVLFGEDPSIPDLIIPEYLCGSPDFAVLRTRSDVIITQDTVIATNEPEAFFENALRCESPIVGDPQQQDVMVWQPSDSADIEEGHALELTFECGSSRGRTKGLSWYVVGLHIDFGLDWSTQPDAVRQAFVDLTAVKIDGLVRAIENACKVLPKKEFKQLLDVAEKVKRLFRRGDYHAASREMETLIQLAERASFAPSDFNHGGNVVMRAHNVKFTLDEKVIGLLP